MFARNSSGNASYPLERNWPYFFRGEPCGIFQSLNDVLFLKLRVGFKDFLSCHPACYLLENNGNCYSHPPDRGLAEANFRVDCNAVQFLHDFFLPFAFSLSKLLPKFYFRSTACHRVSLFFLLDIARKVYRVIFTRKRSRSRISSFPDSSRAIILDSASELSKIAHVSLKSRFRKRKPLGNLSLRAPERCAQSHGKGLRFTRNDNSQIGIWLSAKG